ncbi:hypothetical protein Barb7_01251 [Bacteroidales bacterium Barb7]|nr:hypothetical protein Barb7_01251 [Bacteroidales bacterium Barb7]
MKQVRDLWQTCFHDSEDFVRLFFDHIYKEEQTLTIRKKGEVVSALQILPYTMTWRGGEITVAYIAGCCTSPAERDKGLMRELFGKAHNRIQEKGFDIAALIPAEPWLFDYYRTLGYTEAFNYSLSAYHRPKDPKDTDTAAYHLLPLNEHLAPQWFAFFRQKMRERPACIQHTEADFLNNIIDTQISGGRLYGLLNNRAEPAALAFTLPSEGNIRIKELLYENEEARQALLYMATEACHTEEALCTVSPLPSDSHRYGMAMILNKEIQLSGGYMSLMLD